MAQGCEDWDHNSFHRPSMLQHEICVNCIGTISLVGVESSWDTMGHKVAGNGDAEDAAIREDLRVGTSVAHPAKPNLDRAEASRQSESRSRASASHAAGPITSPERTALLTDRLWVVVDRLG